MHLSHAGPACREISPLPHALPSDLSLTVDLVYDRHPCPQIECPDLLAAQLVKTQDQHALAVAVRGNEDGFPYARVMMETTRWQKKGHTPFIRSIGAAVGILLAMAGALVPTTADFSGDVLARVNSKAITAHEVDFALRRLASDRRVAATREARREALRQLIDQELLIQRGVAIGLLDSDRRVRKMIATAMIDAIVAEVLAKEPTDEALRAFYEAHTASFTVPTRVHVQQIYCRGSGDLTRARAQAEQASAAIAGGMN